MEAVCASLDLLVLPVRPQLWSDFPYFDLYTITVVVSYISTICCPLFSYEAGSQGFLFVHETGHFC